ncbi:MAG: hypothetical protein KDC34_18495 [Saprospiraceae bacterium]|nr:hypothetical protein [Saprospiraceae bacterium]
MKQLFFSILLVLPQLLAAQNMPCLPADGCRCLLDKADAILLEEEPDYQQALYLYFSAQACDEALAEEAEERIVSLFEKIENLRLTAEQLKKTAEYRAQQILKQQDQLVAEKEAAVLATRKAKALNLNNLASRAIAEGKMTVAAQFMQYANTYVPDDPLWLENLQEIFVRSRPEYGRNTGKPIPQKIIPTESSISFIPGNGNILFLDETNGVLKSYDLENDEVQILYDESKVIGTQIAPDSSHFVSWQADFSLINWDRNGNQLKKLQISPERVCFLNQDTIVAWTSDGWFEIWDLKGIQIKKFNLDLRTTDVIPLPNSQGFVTVSSDHLLRFYDLDGNQLYEAIQSRYEEDRRTFYGHYSGWKGIDFLSDGSGFVVFSADSLIHIYNWDGEIITSIENQKHATRLMVLKGEQGIVGYNEGPEIVIWDLDGNQIANINNVREVFGITQFPNGKGILTWDYLESIKLWDLKGNLLRNKTTNIETFDISFLNYSGDMLCWTPTENILRIYNYDRVEIKRFWHEGPVWDFAISPDNKKMATYSKGVGLYIWNLDNYPKYKDLVNGMKQLPDSSRLISWHPDSTVNIWNWKRNEALSFKTGYNVKGVEFLPYNQGYITWSQNGQVSAWDSLGRNLINTTLKAWVSGILFPPETEAIIYWSSDSTLRIQNWDGKFISETKLDDNIRGVYFSRNTHNLLSWTFNSLYINNGEKPIHFSRGAGISQVSEMPDGSGFIASFYGSGIRVWSWSGYEKMTFDPDGSYSGFLLLPDGSGFISWDKNGAIMQWDWAGNTRKINETGNTISKLFLLPNKEGIISLSYYGISIWDWNGNEIINLVPEKGFDGIMFLKDGSGFISWDFGGSIQIWNWQGIQLGQFYHPGSTIKDIILSPDGKSLISWSEQDEIQFWSINPTDILKTGNNIGIRDFTPEEKRKYGIDLDVVVDREYLPYPWLRE